MNTIATDSDPLVDHQSENDRLSNDESEQEHDNQWSATLVQLQRYANMLAHILSLLCVITVIVWISALGGLSLQDGKSKQVFNWHPLLMICAFSFMTVATLSFRLSVAITANRSYKKLLHGIAWSVAALCAFVALLAVFKSHNDAVSGFIANLYSLHSWIGIAVVGMYGIQFLVGIFSFAWPLATMTPTRKARILQLHKFIGPFVYNATAATILLGIQEKEGFIGCSYTVTEADTFPVRHFFDIPSICRTSHLLGILVLAVALCTNLVLYDFRTMSPSPSQHLL